MRDIYFRDKEDPNYTHGTTETSNKLEALNSQIKMTIGTSPGEVLGASQFGAGMHDMLFKFSGSEDSWKSNTYNQLNTYSLLAREYDIDIDTKLLQEGFHDIGIMDIKVGGVSMMGFAFEIE
jgi:hypothetical protein